MNPNNINTQLDRDKARQQYLNALRVQASNNQLNANANMILKQTGATPTQPTDFRTTTERYASLEEKRVLLEKELRSITDGTSASVVAHTLTPNEVEFAVGAMPFIQRELSSKYALGAPAPIIENFIRSLQQKEALTNGVEFGLQQATGRDILLSNQEILNYMPDKRQIEELLHMLREMRDSPTKRKVEEDLENIKKMIPTEEQLSKLDKLSPDQKEIFYQELDEGLATIPSKQQLDNIQSRLEKVESDSTAFERSLIEINSELQQRGADIKRMERVNEELNTMSSSEFISSKMPDFSIELSDWKKPPYSKGNPTLEQKREYIKQISLDNIENRERLKESQIFVPVDSKEFKKGFRLGVNSPKKIKNHDELNKVYEAILEALAQFETKAPPEMQNQPEGEAVQGKGIKGCGLAKQVKQKRSNRLVHLTEGPVEKPKPYVPFGRYVIHRYDLDKGKLNVKTPKGGAIKELPSQKISLDLGKMLHSISKGILPDYDKVNALKDEDKEILHRVIQHSRMGDRVSVPTPKSKTEEEKISDRFDILKGEIIAGNDSPKIVKELKTLLMRLIHTGRIPRKEAHDILIDLASLGI